MPESHSPTRDWAIYKVTNPSGGIYIGKTYNFNGRIGNYKRMAGGLKSQRLLYSSLQKYGFNNHSITIIDSFNSTTDYADGKEMFWIRSYMSNLTKWRSSHGMNLTDGGEGAPGAKFPNRISPFKGKKHTEEQKKKLSHYFKENPARYWLGKKMEQKSRNKMSLAKKGKVSTFKGKKHSEYSNNKNRLSHNPIPVLVFDLNGVFLKEFASIKFASKEMKVAQWTITLLCKGVTQKPTKYIFKYK